MAYPVAMREVEFHRWWLPPPRESAEEIAARL
jgi:hypothetical protein